MLYNELLGMWVPGYLEITVILVILLLLFGKRLPEIARSIGRSFNEFRKGIKEVEDTKEEIKKDIHDAMK